MLIARVSPLSLPSSILTRFDRSQSSIEASVIADEGLWPFHHGCCCASDGETSITFHSPAGLGVVSEAFAIAYA